ncbi:S8/S53 family peptidase [Sorangium sp. So ce726]|uniref:S8 family peptidase n=1 Tax=Sorangium sp. So ce726 TaxID=3133319 RepID=UPI003F60AEB0
MCDFVEGQLILSHHVTDHVAAELVKEIRKDLIPRVRHLASMKERLEQLQVHEDLPWEIHLIGVPLGEEIWKINLLHKLYTERSARSRLHAPHLASSDSATTDDFIVLPNSRLSFTSVDFTFSASHSKYTRMIGSSGFGAGTGAGVSVAIIDSGIESGTHFNVTKSLNVFDVTKNTDVADERGHGTILASIVHDLAPDADLWIYKIAGKGSQINEWDVLTALAAAKNANVINMSLGFGLRDRICGACGRQTQSARSAVFENVLTYVLQNEYVVVVAAAGNDGRRELRFPSRFDEVVAVGSIDSSSTLSNFSNYGAVNADGGTHSHLYLVPGGQTQVGASPPTATETVGTTKNPPADQWGTSFSTAYASGAIALMFSSKYPMPKRNSVLTHLQLNADTASIVGYSIGDHGHGILKVAAIP